MSASGKELQIALLKLKCTVVYARLVDEGLAVRTKDFGGIDVNKPYEQIIDLVRRRAKARLVNRYRFMTPLWRRFYKRF